MRLLLALLLLAAAPCLAQTGRSHAIAVLGTPALPPDFPHFPYVNPNAPKGGEVTFGQTGSFDGFNPFILRGNPALGLGAQWQPGIGGTASGSAGGHVWESMLVGSADEIDSAYCHVCETVELAPDRLSIAFDIRPEARFADGKPITAEDVVWTFETLLEKGRPTYRVTYAEVASVEAVSPSRVVFRFKTDTNRDLPIQMGGLPILPKHWFANRDFARQITESPLGSGPYRVDGFELGRTVTYARRDDWWAKDRPTGRGFHNFDRVKIEYFRDATVLFQAFKAGQIDYRGENISRQWATAYDFPAVAKGFVQKQELSHKLPIGIQGWLFNTRRPLFQDARVREALGQVFDFEYMNKTLFYGQYQRTRSYFGNTPGEAQGLPGPDEMKLLEPIRAQLPPALFTEPFTLATTDGSGANREGLRRAIALLAEAGWTVKDRKLVDRAGKQMALSILLSDPSYERMGIPYQQWLQRLGIEVQVRTVDPAQFQRLTDEFDFDVMSMIYPGSDLPGLELKSYYGCETANVPGSNNVAGLCNKAVDTLIEAAMAARDRETLFIATRALDRALLRTWIMVPMWHDTKFKVATWDRFGRPSQPVLSGFVLDSWWIDPARAAATDAARKAGG